MHYNFKEVPHTLLRKICVKNVLVGYIKLKETCLKTKMKSKTDHCALLPINKLYGGYIKGLGEETGEFFHHVFCGKLDNITQKQMDSMLYIIKAKKVDKSNIYTYISYITLHEIYHILILKIIIYLVLNLQICFTIISSYSGLVMGARFGNGCGGCKASKLQLC